MLNLLKSALYFNTHIYTLNSFFFFGYMVINKTIQTRPFIVGILETHPFNLFVYEQTRSP